MVHEHHCLDVERTEPTTTAGHRKAIPYFSKNMLDFPKCGPILYRNQPPQILKATKEKMAGHSPIAMHLPACGNTCRHPFPSDTHGVSWHGCAAEGQHWNSANARLKQDLLLGSSLFPCLIKFPLTFTTFLWTSLPHNFKLNILLNQSITIVYSIFDLSGWLSLPLTD